MPKLQKKSQVIILAKISLYHVKTLFFYHSYRLYLYMFNQISLFIKYQLNTLKNELLNFLNESAHCWRILPTKAESVNKI